MTLPDPIIRTEALTRDFKKTRAVDALDLSIAQGELFGLVGPDGAGKTTTLRLLAGLLDITSGSANVAGYDLTRRAEPVKSLIGYMAQRFSLYSELTVLENLRFFSELYDVDPAARESRTERLLDFAGLVDFKARRAAHLSGGMKKKLALACTLIHQPPILFLDEPTTGVDPVSRREFWEILTQLYAEGTTIVVSTPYMDEADRCSRVGLMYEGRLMRCDQPQVIRREIEGDLIELQATDWQAAHREATSFPGVREVQTYGESIHLIVDSAETRLPEIREYLDAHDIEYRTLRQTTPRMEEAFISFIRQMDREQEG